MVLSRHGMLMSQTAWSEGMSCAMCKANLVSVTRTSVLRFIKLLQFCFFKP